MAGLAPRHAAEHIALRRPRGGWSYAELHAAARAGRRSWRAAAPPPGRASRSRFPPASSSRRRCTRACCSARSPFPSTCAFRGRARAHRRGAAVRVEEPLASRRRGRARPWRSGAARPRRDRRRDPYLGHDRRAAAGRADLRQPAVERARLGGGARTGPRERWLCALPLHTWAACRSCCARRSTRPRRSCTSASRRSRVLRALQAERGRRS